MRKKLLISFSGGRTSGYMLWWLLNCWEDRDNWEIVVVFANTGKEDEETLKFVQACSEKFNVQIVWVEGEPKWTPPRITKKGKKRPGGWWGVKHHVVDFTTACRDGAVFERFISKLGIPSTNAPWCSKQMKQKTIKAYLRSIGWKGYYTAIGIRYDEPNRILPSAKKNRIIYFLNEFTVMSKWDIRFWWALRDFDLQVEPGFGNCDDCFKKSTLDLVKNAIKRPKSFNWWQDMTDKFGHLNPRKTHLKPPFNFYRGNLSPADIIKLSIEQAKQMTLYEQLDGCSESCEAF